MALTAPVPHLAEEDLVRAATVGAAVSGGHDRIRFFADLCTGVGQCAPVYQHRHMNDAFHIDAAAGEMVLVEVLRAFMSVVTARSA
jgi:hypothetical protein